MLKYYRVFAAIIFLIVGGCAGAHTPPAVIYGSEGVRNAPIGSMLVDFDYKDDSHGHVLESFGRDYTWKISAIEMDESIEIMFCGGWPKQYNHAKGYGCFVTTGPFVDIHEVDKYAPEFNDALEGYICINPGDIGKTFKAYLDSQDFSGTKRTQEPKVFTCRKSFLKD